MKKNNRFTLVERKRSRKIFQNKTEKKFESPEEAWQFYQNKKEAHSIKKPKENKKQKNKLGLEPEYEKALSLNNKYYQNVDLSKIQWEELLDYSHQESANDSNFTTTQISLKHPNNKADMKLIKNKTKSFLACNILQQGFSLLELMFVMTIIGILGTIAIPAYRDYIIRAKVTEMITLAQPMRLAVTESILSGTGLAQIDNAKLGLPKIENKGRIKELNVTAGIINIIANPKEIGLEENKVFKISLTPTNEDMLIQWKCTIEPAELKKYAPESCRS